MKLLIVDDEKKIVDFLSHAIKWSNYGFNEILSLTSSKHALLEIESGYMPDLLITDIRMPEVTGIDLAQKIAGSCKTIIISGYSDFAYAQKAIRYGVSDYLLKPIFPDELEIIIDNLTKNISVEKIADNISFNSFYLSLLSNEIHTDKYYLDVFHTLLSRNYIPGLLPYGAPAILSFCWEGKNYGFFKVESKNNLHSQFSQRLFFKNIYKEELPDSLIDITIFHNDILLNQWDNVIERLYKLKNNNGQSILTKLRVSYLVFKSYPEALDALSIKELIELGLNNNLASYLYTKHSTSKIEMNEQVILIVKDYIKNNLNEILTIDLLADIVHMHPVYLSKVYKQQTGENLSQYILEQRLIQMEKLLLTTDLQIKTISELVGYQKPQNITEAFKKKYGITPSQYRKIYPYLH